MRILYLEDRKDTAIEIEDCLTSAGYELFPCSRIEDAIKALERERFDLVISGTHLEAANPFDLVSCMRNSIFKDIPIILIDSHQTALAKAVNEAVKISCHMMSVTHYLAMEDFDSKLFRNLIEQTVKASRPNLQEGHNISLSQEK